MKLKYFIYGELEVGFGDIVGIITEGIEVSKGLGIPISFKINQITLQVYPTSNIADTYDVYEKGLQKRRDELNSARFLI